MAIGIKSFIKGIKLKLAAYDVAVHGTEGAVWLENDTGNKLKVFSNSAKREIITDSETQVLTNKTISTVTNTISGLANTNIAANAAIDATKIADGTVTNTEFQFLDASSSIQGQLNGKEPTLAKTNLAETTSSVLTISNGTNAVIGASPVTIEVDQADTSNDGYLSSTDWNTFNSKEPTVAKTNLTEATSSILTISNGTGAVIGSSPVTIAVTKADVSHDGYLSQGDWATFNGKQAAGSYATLAGTEALTNKDYQGGTASDTSRVTIPKNTKTNLDGLTRKEATVVYASDLDKLYVDNGTDLVEVGSGGGAGDSDTINLLRAANFTAITDLDLSGNNAAFDGGGSITASSLSLSTTAADLILADSVIKYAPGADGINDYFGYTQAIPQGLRGRDIGFSFEYKNDATVVDNDFTFNVKLKDGASAGYIYTDNMTKYNTANNEAVRFSQGYYIPADCTAVEFGWQNKSSTTTVVLLLDNILVSSSPFVYKNMIQENSFFIGTANGYGSTLTSVRKFSGTPVQLGTDVTYTSSAADGDSFTINETGNYSITYIDKVAGTASVTAYILLNGTTAAAALGSSYQQVASEIFNQVVTRKFSAGDVIRLFVNTPARITGTTDTSLSITRTSESEHVVTPAKSGIEEVYYNGYTSRDAGTGFLKLKTKQRSTANAILTESSSGNYTIYTLKKKAIVFASTSVRLTGVDNIYLRHYNSSNVLLSFSSGGPGNTSYNLGNGFLPVVGNTGDYFVVWTPNCNTDSTITMFSIVAVDFEQQVLSAIPTQQTCYIKDVKAQNTAGGTFTSGDEAGTWGRLRDLNVINETGSTTTGSCSFATLAASIFTITRPGTYNIKITAPAGNTTNRHQAALYSGTTLVLLGSVGLTDGGANHNPVSYINGTVTISSPTSYMLRHKCETTANTSGFGLAANLALEVYTQVEITKIS